MRRYLLPVVAALVFASLTITAAQAETAKQAAKAETAEAHHTKSAAKTEKAEGHYIKSEEHHAKSAEAVASQHCRDAKGKFISCGDKPKEHEQCRDAHGKFVTCKK